MHGELLLLNSFDIVKKILESAKNYDFTFFPLLLTSTFCRMVAYCFAQIGRTLGCSCLMLRLLANADFKC